MYTIIDIETTGGSPKNDKITEIAIYVHDGKRIVNEFISLINPERSIPYFITGLTGITNEMVADAPKFYELAREIVELTDGNVFVAHNAGFDYQFIRHEFKALGYPFRREVLCTLKLSRKLIPDLVSYSLGNLCDDLKIRINNRHRAAGDALATVGLFELLLSLDQGPDSLINNPELSRLNPALDRRIIEELPEEPGVYYFYDSKEEIIYIGKSRNIHQRVITHLRNSSSKRAMEMKDRIADIGYEVTGSELIALLLESYEIKKYKPVYNRSQRRTSFFYGIYSFENEDGYICFSIRKNCTSGVPLTCFSTFDRAKKHMLKILEEFQLCQKFTGLYDSKGACFHQQIGICHGACAGLEPLDEYNLRARKALRTFEYDHQNFFIIDTGKDDDQRSVIKVENGTFTGFGFADLSEIRFGLEILHDCIKPHQDNRDIQQIIRSYLRKRKVERIIPF